MGVEVGVGDGVGVAMSLTPSLHGSPPRSAHCVGIRKCATIHTIVIALYQTLRYS